MRPAFNCAAVRPGVHQGIKLASPILVLLLRAMVDTDGSTVSPGWIQETRLF
jgi:hypothetical protein